MAKQVVKTEKTTKEKEITLHDAVIHLQDSIDVIVKENEKRDKKIAELTKKIKDLKEKKKKVSKK